MKYFSLDELVRSDIATKKRIDNTPTPEIMFNLTGLIDFLDGVREKWGSAIRVNSGYRCEKLNKAVGGVANSVHMKGYAADIYPVNDQFERFVDFMKKYLRDKQFDQCIIEKSGASKWVHISLFNNKGEQRRQIFNLEV